MQSIFLTSVISAHDHTAHTPSIPDHHDHTGPQGSPHIHIIGQHSHSMENPFGQLLMRLRSGWLIECPSGAVWEEPSWKFGKSGTNIVYETGTDIIAWLKDHGIEPERVDEDRFSFTPHWHFEFNSGNTDVLFKLAFCG